MNLRTTTGVKYRKGTIDASGGYIECCEGVKSNTRVEYERRTDMRSKYLYGGWGRRRKLELGTGRRLERYRWWIMEK